MSKRYSLLWLYALTILVIIFNIGANLKNYLFADINDLPVGELLYSLDSPAGDKKMNFYLVKNSFGEGVRGELETGDKKSNIFWQTGTDSVHADWLQDDYILINDIPLTVTGEFKYDCRKGTSLFSDGALREEFINGNGKK